MSATRRSVSLFWFPLAFIAAALVFRWMKLTSEGMTLLPNFSPWMALAFTGTLVMPRALPWWTWPVAMLGINAAALGVTQALDPESLAIYAMYGAAALVASRCRGSLNVLAALAGAAFCGVLFYLVTNSAAWMVETGYAKTLAGWWQAQTTGLPGFPPSWVFLKNSLLSDLAFSSLLLVAFKMEARVRAADSMPWAARVTA